MRPLSLQDEYLTAAFFNTGQNKVYFASVEPLIYRGATNLYFINILRAAFTGKDPKSAKHTVKLSLFLVLLGSGHVKAAHKMLVESTPGIHVVKDLGRTYSFTSLK